MERAPTIDIYFGAWERVLPNMVFFQRRRLRVKGQHEQKQLQIASIAQLLSRSLFKRPPRRFEIEILFNCSYKS